MRYCWIFTLSWGILLHFSSYPGVEAYCALFYLIASYCTLSHLVADRFASLRDFAPSQPAAGPRRHPAPPQGQAGLAGIDWLFPAAGGRLPTVPVAARSSCGHRRGRRTAVRPGPSAGFPACPSRRLCFWCVYLSPAVFLVCISLAGCVSGVYLSRRLCFWCVYLSPAVFPSRCVPLAGFLFGVSPSPVFFSLCLPRRFSFRRVSLAGFLFGVSLAGCVSGVSLPDSPEFWARPRLRRQGRPAHALAGPHKTGRRAPLWGRLHGGLGSGRSADIEITPEIARDRGEIAAGSRPGRRASQALVLGDSEGCPKDSNRCSDDSERCSDESERCPDDSERGRGGNFCPDPSKNSASGPAPGPGCLRAVPALGSAPAAAPILARFPATVIVLTQEAVDIGIDIGRKSIVRVYPPTTGLARRRGRGGAGATSKGRGCPWTSPGRRAYAVALVQGTYVAWTVRFVA